MTTEAYILSAAGALLMIEIALGCHRGVHRLQDCFIVVTSVASSFIVRPSLAWLTGTVIGFLLPWWKGQFSWVPLWVSFPTILVLAEFAQYWLHRWAHDSNNHPFLYGMHRTHHSAPYVNVTLIYRSNLLWSFIHPYAWVAAVAIYLGQLKAAELFFLVGLLWNVVTHSDWRWDDAMIAKVPGGSWLVNAFELVFVTPRLHHAHHGYGHDGCNFRNFNAVLTVFDRAFGTLHVPKGRPWRYGLPGGEHHWLRQMLFPLLPLGPALRRDRLGRTISGNEVRQG